MPQDDGNVLAVDSPTLVRYRLVEGPYRFALVDLRGHVRIDPQR